MKLKKDLNLSTIEFTVELYKSFKFIFFSSNKTFSNVFPLLSSSNNINFSFSSTFCNLLSISHGLRLLGPLSFLNIIINYSNIVLFIIFNLIKILQDKNPCVCKK
jgi:hypothetical protein